MADTDDTPDPRPDPHPDLGPVEAVVLREGPRSRKVARYMVVKNRHTGEVHHHALTIETGRKKQGTWELDDKKTISLADEDEDEIGKLIGFLQKCRAKAAGAGESPAAAASDLDGLVARMSGLRGAVDELRAIARAVRVGGADLGAVGGAIAFGAGARAMDRLRQLLGRPADGDPAALRDMLALNPWLAGLGHAQPAAPPGALAGSAEWLFVEAADGKPVLLLVGGPAAGALMGFDAALGAFEPALGLVKGLAAIADALPLCPPGTRGVLVGGADGEDAAKAALARFAAALGPVEVQTWDQVLRTGHRVLETWRVAAKKA